MRRPSSWSSRAARATAALLVPAALAATAATAGAQGGWEGVCGALAEPDRAECLLAVATARSIQERVGVALWGGSPVPGTASTLGMRIGSTPRLSLSGRVAMVPTTVPPLLDRSRDRASRTTLWGFSGQGTIGVLPGWSPAPTVGGVLSVDLIARASLATLPSDVGFQDRMVMGWAGGVRIGALRESFTTPGVSLTTSYGRSGVLTLGDPTAGATDGYLRGSVSDLNATLAASRRIAAARITAGAALDRYRTGARIGYRSESTSGPGERQGTLTTDRWSGFLNLSWTALIFHASAELGWQDSPAPAGLPPGVNVDPAAWWGGLAFRVSI